MSYKIGPLIGFYGIGFMHWVGSIPLYDIEIRKTNLSLNVPDLEPEFWINFENLWFALGPNHPK